MAFKVDIENADGQTYGYWEIPQAFQQYNNSRLVVDVIGYKNKAAMLAGKSGWHKKVVIEGPAWQTNLKLNEIEAAIMALPEFVGSTVSA